MEEEINGFKLKCFIKDLSPEEKYKQDYIHVKNCIEAISKANTETTENA